MNPLSRSIIILILINAPKAPCILLNLAERHALKRQHSLAQEIRTRLSALSETEDPEASTEELISRQCNIFARDELGAMATIIAAYKNNHISERAAGIALENAHIYTSSQCKALAEFWQATEAISALEIRRTDIFEE